MEETRPRWVFLRRITALTALMFLATGVASAQSVTAVWDPNPPADAVTSYQVCVGTSSLSCNVQLASVAATSSSYTFAPAPGVLHYIAVRATNSFGVGLYSDEESFSIPSFAQPANRSTSVGVAITPVNLSVTDPDGDSLSFTHTGLPVGLTLNAATGRITGTPSAAGTYNVTVFVTDGLATVERSFTWTVTGGAAPLTLTGLTSSRSSPQPVNTAITFTATATGGTTPYQFKWWLYNGTTWSVLRNWNTQSTYTWTPTTANSAYQIRVWARNAGSTADTGAVNRVVPFVITAAPPPLTISSLTSNRPSPQRVGTLITFTATATGGTAPYQYKWWVFNGTTWTIVRNWSTDRTFVWQPTVARSNYQVRVWVRNAGVTADVGDVNRSIPFSITP